MKLFVPAIFLSVVFYFGIFAITAAASAATITAVKVTAATDQTFASLTRDKIALVLFTADGCDDCKSFERILEATAADTDFIERVGTTGGVALLTVNYALNQELSSRFNIGEVPTMRVVWQNNGFDRYRGEVSPKALTRYFTKELAPPLVTTPTPTSTLLNIDGDDEEHKYSAVLFTWEQNDDAHVQFYQVAKEMKRDTTFSCPMGVTFMPSIDKPFVRVYRNPSVYTSHENKTDHYEDYFGPFNSLSKFRAFLIAASNPTVEELRSNAQLEWYGTRGIKMGWLFLPLHKKGTTEQTQFLADLHTHVALPLRGNITFVYVFVDVKNVSKNAFEKRMSGYGVHATDVPALALDPLTVAVYAAKGNVIAESSISSVNSFVEMWLSGSLRRSALGSPHHARVSPSGVLHITRESFEEALLSPASPPTIYVLVVHSPHCARCKTFLEEHFEANAVPWLVEQGFVPATLDFTLNSVPAPFTVGSYPTIYAISHLEDGKLKKNKMYHDASLELAEQKGSKNKKKYALTSDGLKAFVNDIHQKHFEQRKQQQNEDSDREL
eukprot:PhM_4_TR17602/c0_g1_i1/m.28743/K08056/PDIA3, GRP58; protein disulfide isomerase family A, member 3